MLQEKDYTTTLLEHKTLWTMYDLMAHTNKSRNTLLKKLLLNPKHQSKIAEFTHAPAHKNHHWSFVAKYMKQYIEENHNRIF
ncbi:hypothetical protein HMPREF3124_05825 [Staphylococcus sp. HMSC12H08]|uniref:DUF771 domain-containing protein n=1 Tax=Staphylococcus sp. HMSC12H08 TaxID=1581092 RepID=UPI0008A5CDBF|nr:DUF771 domain-containing protein [Staphylococcus sp. HMSC12H08]OFV06297.1 hypothetical protein HMPREF3124_05825 [Staphylococcus sp. HMSC12H08]